VDWSPEIQSIADTVLPPTTDAITALANLHRFINSFIREDRPTRKPATILESTMTPATEVLQTHMVSCGAVSTLGASLLRCQGQAVKLVHGMYRGMDHAWLELWNASWQQWLPFDLMENNNPRDGLKPGHQKLAECADWPEIRSILAEAQKKYSSPLTRQP
jgi:transglutaminase-like putative cysteine protease